MLRSAVRRLVGYMPSSLDYASSMLLNNSTDLPAPGSVRCRNATAAGYRRAYRGTLQAKHCTRLADNREWRPSSVKQQLEQRLQIVRKTTFVNYDVPIVVIFTESDRVAKAGGLCIANR